ncbi:helix-turn-helix domain-containing protein [Streptomyces sp. NPDC094149]|uniref:helix-turn-helix domain-containing protein n=1 Tax=Streptomyces sp. NPDC094149 TaxID=3155079 RepID=UPI003322556D
MSAGDEVEEFAALLRRLKDRTDRSYGSLARRLHMNTSTLHRYCAGEAVPQEYAPVERLAAFCAATPEERLELHRLWLRAAAARQRPRPTGGGTPEETAAVTGPGAAGVTAAAAGVTAAATGPAAAGVTAAAAGPAAAAGVTAAATGPGAAETTAAKGTAAATGPGAAEESAAATRPGAAEETAATAGPGAPEGSPAADGPGTPEDTPTVIGPGVPESPPATTGPGAPGNAPAANEPTPTDEPPATGDAVAVDGAGATEYRVTADRPGATECAVAAQGPDAAQEPDAALGLDAAQEPDAALGLDAAQEPGSGAGAAAGPAPEPAPPSAPVAGPRFWYRRRRVMGSVGVVGALLASLGSLSALSDDRSPQARAPHGSTAPRTTAPGAPWRPAKPSAGSSPTTAPNSSSPEAGKNPTASAAPGGGSGGTGGTGGRPTGLPLAWTVDSQVWQGGCGHDYVIDKPPAQVPPPPVQQDAGTWAATQGAVHGRQTLVQVSVQGRSSTAVVLEALRVRIVGRGQPLTGNSYAMEQGCGGELTPRSFTVNLDADRPVARPKDGADSEHTIPAVHFPYRVSAQDPEVLLVDATTRAHDARWYLELDWSSQGRKGTIRIDDHGRPFHTSGITDMPRYWYGTNDSGDRAWVPYDS